MPRARTRAIGRPPRVPPALSDMQARAWALRRAMTDLMAVQAMIERLLNPPAPPRFDPLDDVLTTEELAERLGL